MVVKSRLPFESAGAALLAIGRAMFAYQEPSAMLKRVIPAAVSIMAVAAAPLAAEDVTRASDPAVEQDNMGGSSIVLAILAAVAIALGILIAADSSEDSVVSP